MQLKYRADVDGLRAVAVLAVIFFHADVKGFSGGFVGVDIFFVISGFLITSIILTEIKNGHFSVARFYERRIRRIFPPLFSVIIFVLIIGTIILDPLSFKDLGNTLTATSLFVSNILFWRRAGYFDLGLMERPLLHTWSLAVEEQFYIIFPLLLVAISRFLNKKYLSFLFGICIVSFLASIYGVYNYPVATFYLMPTRAWELLFGSVLALDETPQLKSNTNRNIGSIIGISLIVYSIIRYSPLTLFPGPNALLPVLGACLIIYSGGGGKEVIVNKFLSLKPIVYIGLISYSLYLWHWPLIVIAKYLILRELTGIEIILIIAVTFIISAISLKYIEYPFRKKHPVIPERKKLFVLSGIITLILVTIGVTIHTKKGFPDRSPSWNGIITNAATDPLWKNFEKNEKNLDELPKGNGPDLIGPTSGKLKFALWGDSHAGNLVDCISDLATKYNISGFNIAHGHAVLPLLGINVVDRDYVFNEADYNKSVIEFIKIHPEIETIIIAGFWSAETKMVDVNSEYSGNQPQHVLLEAGLRRSVNALLKMGKKVILVSDVPTLKAKPNSILFIANMLNKAPNFEKISPTIEEYNIKNKDIQLIFDKISANSNVTIIHPESKLFDKKGRAIVMIMNKMLYIDNCGHLTSIGSKYISTSFDDLFKKMIK